MDRPVGVGPRLGRPDGFPIGDLALRRTVSSLYFGGEEIDDRRLLEFSERWSPWRSYATSYLVRGASYWANRRFLVTGDQRSMRINPLGLLENWRISR